MRKWLRDLRKSQGLSESAVGAAAGITQVAYHKIETGERTPRTETAKKIAAVLEFEWTRFYEDEEENEED